MKALTYSHTRQHLAEVMRQVNEDRAPVIVTTQRGEPVVIMSLADYNALEETAYLTRSLKTPSGWPMRRQDSTTEKPRKGRCSKTEASDADQV